MATQIDYASYASMAGAAYISNRSEINQLPIPTGWDEIKDSYRNLSSGFEAVSFQSESDSNEIVISFAGTDNLSLGDDWSDYALIAGNYCEQLKDAAQYYLDIKAKNLDAHITLTGHSLGGGLAALIGVFFNEQAITFDQIPVKNSALQDHMFPNQDAFAELLGALKDQGLSQDVLQPLQDFCDDPPSYPQENRMLPTYVLKVN
jgi:Mbeg1-like